MVLGEKEKLEWVCFKARRDSHIRVIGGDACWKIKIKPLRETNVCAEGDHSKTDFMAFSQNFFKYSHKQYLNGHIYGDFLSQIP